MDVRTLSLRPFLGAFVIASACIGDSAASPRPDAPPETPSPAIDGEFAERELAYQLAVIRSSADLDLHRQLRDSPLNLLSPGARQRFLDSPVFGQRGLASFDYLDLRMELTAAQIYRLLQLFGVQRSLTLIPQPRVESPADAAVMAALSPGAIIRRGIDYGDHWCESRATCRRSTGAICIGDNC